MLAQVDSVTWQRNRQWPMALPTPEGLPPPPPCKPYWAGKEGEGLRGQGACLESHSERHGVVLAEGGGPPYRHRALGAEPTSWPAPLRRPSGAARGLGAVTAPRSQRLLPGQRPPCVWWLSRWLSSCLGWAWLPPFEALPCCTRIPVATEGTGAHKSPTCFPRAQPRSDISAPSHQSEPAAAQPCPAARGGAVRGPRAWRAVGVSGHRDPAEQGDSEAPWGQWLVSVALVSPAHRCHAPTWPSPRCAASFPPVQVPRACAHVAGAAASAPPPLLRAQAGTRRADGRARLHPGISPRVTPTPQGAVMSRRSGSPSEAGRR